MGINQYYQQELNLEYDVCIHATIGQRETCNQHMSSNSIKKAHNGTKNLNHCSSTGTIRDDFLHNQPKLVCCAGCEVVFNGSLLESSLRYKMTELSRG